ncbi:MAG TPA: hypothetical protein VFI18_06875 [Gaiellales bacterium]|nr:hypothetical protein [Gaiellales bacterium]
MASFPTPQHAAAAAAAVAFVSTLPDAEAVSLVGSCARRADANDLDLSVLVRDEASAARVETAFAEFAPTAEPLAELAALGPFVEVDLDATTGDFGPGPRGWTTGPDAFEVAVGNELAYAVPLWERGDRLAELRARWLPYYDDELRATRLGEARMYVMNDLDHVPLMVRRDEPFHAFHRLYLAFQGFLQAVFIARRTYPIAYDKWIREQVEGILGLPHLYGRLPAIVGVDRLSLPKLTPAAEELRALLDAWAPPP